MCNAEGLIPLFFLISHGEIMISGLFIFFTAVAFIFAIVGYLLSNEVMMVIGFLIFGFMSFPLLNQNLEYKTGEIITYNQSNTSKICNYELSLTDDIYQYGDNYTGYHWDYTSPSPSVNDVNLFHRNTTYEYDLICNGVVNEIKSSIYTPYTDTIWYGIFMIFISISGLFSTYNLYGHKGD